VIVTGVGGTGHRGNFRRTTSQAVVRLADDRSLAGRVLAWWSEDAPRLIEFGDRGYRDFVEMEIRTPTRS